MIAAALAAYRLLQGECTGGRVHVTLAEPDTVTVWHVRLTYTPEAAIASTLEDEPLGPATSSPQKSPTATPTTPPTIIQLAVLLPPQADSLPRIHVLRPRVTAPFIHRGCVCLQDFASNTFAYTRDQLVALLETVYAKLDPSAMEVVVPPPGTPHTVLAEEDPNGDFDGAADEGRTTDGYSADERAMGDSVVALAHPEWSLSREPTPDGSSLCSATLSSCCGSPVSAGPALQGGSFASTSPKTWMQEPSAAHPWRMVDLVDGATDAVQRIEAATIQELPWGRMPTVPSAEELPSVGKQQQQEEEEEEEETAASATHDSMQPPSRQQLSVVVINVGGSVPLRRTLVLSAGRVLFRRTPDVTPDPHRAFELRGAIRVDGARTEVVFDGISLEGTLLVEDGAQVELRDLKVRHAAVRSGEQSRRVSPAPSCRAPLLPPPATITCTGARTTIRCSSVHIESAAPAQLAVSLASGAAWHGTQCDVTGACRFAGAAVAIDRSAFHAAREGLKADSSMVTLVDCTLDRVLTGAAQSDTPLEQHPCGCRRWSNAPGEPTVGLAVGSLSTLRGTKLTVRGFFFGVFVTQSHAVLSDCSVSVGSQGYQAKEAYMELVRCTSHRVHQVAAYAEAGSRMVLSDCAFQSCIHGVEAAASRVVGANTTVTGQEMGFFLLQGSSAQLRGCTATETQQAYTCCDTGCVLHATSCDAINCRVAGFVVDTGRLVLTGEAGNVSRVTGVAGVGIEAKGKAVARVRHVRVQLSPPDDLLGSAAVRAEGGSVLAIVDSILDAELPCAFGVLAVQGASVSTTRCLLSAGAFTEGLRAEGEGTRVVSDDSRVPLAEVIGAAALHGGRIEFRGGSIKGGSCAFQALQGGSFAVSHGARMSSRVESDRAECASIDATVRRSGNTNDVLVASP